MQNFAYDDQPYFLTKYWSIQLLTYLRTLKITWNSLELYWTFWVSRTFKKLIFEPEIVNFFSCDDHLEFDATSRNLYVCINLWFIKELPGTLLHFFEILESLRRSQLFWEFNYLGSSTVLFVTTIRSLLNTRIGTWNM